MRLPTKPDGLENGSLDAQLVNRDPSYPDRERIDSDVRAFLRPASSPWIVFDRDSRIDDFARSALRLGAVFASSPSLMDVVRSAPPASDVSVSSPATAPLTGAPATASPMFPPSTGPTEPVVEPSNLAVATDLMPPAHGDTPSLGDEVDAPFPSASITSRRIASIAAACAGVLALVAGGVVVARGPLSMKHATAAHAVAVAVPAPVPVPSPVVAPVQPAEPAATADPETIEIDEAPAAATPAKPAETNAEGKKHRLGKLTVKGDSKTKNVWFDGKRMLGTGTRSFLVACGMHTVAVNEKTDVRDIEVPCNGEYVAGK
jgi:hypothetical protein